jgi:hypothetical protein
MTTLCWNEGRMTMGYDVWDLSSGNLVRDFASEHEALVFVRHAMTTIGRRAVSRWALLVVEGDDDQEKDTRVLAQGAALVKLAAQSIPA